MERPEEAKNCGPRHSGYLGALHRSKKHIISQQSTCWTSFRFAPRFFPRIHNQSLYNSAISSLAPLCTAPSSCQAPMPWTLDQLQHRTPETPGRQQTSYEQPNQAMWWTTPMALERQDKKNKRTTTTTMTITTTTTAHNDGQGYDCDDQKRAARKPLASKAASKHAPSCMAIMATSSYLACPPAVKTLPPWSWKALLDGHCTLGCAAYLTASSSSDQGKGQAEHHQHQHQQQNQRGKARQGKAPLDQTEREAFPTLDKTDVVKAVPGSPSWIWPWDIAHLRIVNRPRRLVRQWRIVTAAVGCPASSRQASSYVHCVDRTDIRLAAPLLRSCSPAAVAVAAARCRAQYCAILPALYFQIAQLVKPIRAIDLSIALALAAEGSRPRQYKTRMQPAFACSHRPPLNPLGSANSISTSSATRRCAQAKVEAVPPSPNQRRRDQGKPQLRAVPSNRWVPPPVFQSPILQTPLSFSPARCSTMRAVIVSRLTSTRAGVGGLTNHGVNSTRLTAASEICLPRSVSRHEEDPMKREPIYYNPPACACPKSTRLFIASATAGFKHGVYSTRMRIMGHAHLTPSRISRPLQPDSHQPPSRTDALRVWEGAVTRCGHHTRTRTNPYPSNPYDQRFLDPALRRSCHPACSIDSGFDTALNALIQTYHGLPMTCSTQVPEKHHA
ncbi:uncharacterized protein CLUP02_00804 [Colletotrichum lupini]|uniref:Uncharacterized protein n=1 Tax=Colletotrichum lupini TaxID=145971 RepID=A0A9Q8SC27_9PEZI|nr:uncharacterized protein CLUP02_00804 [Colletotrichum lupini]UQC74156.1 hypothetical protein CLUP02_00804 [Colletotrichum lupini]